MRSWIVVLAVALTASALVGCSSENGESCNPGSEGCECAEGNCLSGLVCLSNVCVDRGSGGTGGSGGGGGAGAMAGSSGNGGTGGNGGDAGSGGGGGVGWRAPVRLKETRSPVGPKVATDSSGNVIAVWTDRNAVGSSGWSSRYVPGVGWNTATMLQNDDPSISGIASLAVDPSGNATVVSELRDITSDYYGVSAHHYTPSTGWSGAVPVDDDAVGAFPIVIVDSSGVATALWSESQGVTNSVMASRYEPGSGWAAPVTVEADARSAHGLDAVVDLDGNVTVAWAEYTGGFNTFGIWAARYTPGAGWGAAVPLEDQDFGDARRPKVVVDVGGTVTVVWQERASQDTGVPSHIWSARYVPGGGWGGPVLVESFDGNSAFGSAAVYSNGDVLAVWSQDEEGSGQFDLWSSRYTSSSGWLTPVRVEPGGDRAIVGLVVIDLNDVATVVWDQPDGQWRSLWANRQTPGEGWGTPVVIENADREDADSHSVTVDPQGRVTVVWRQAGRNGNGIWAARYE